MKKELQKVVAETRQWVQQEKMWGGDFFATQAAAEKQEPAATVVQRLGVAQVLRPASPPAPHVPLARGEAPAGASSKAEALKGLYDIYHTCTRCPLGESRLNFVFGVGSPDAKVMLIGEGPGYDEDHKGEPFIGRSGKLLDKMMEAIGLSRQSIYIANIVKCHPMINPLTPEERGNDRPPTPLESGTCSPILQQQIAIIQPRVIMTLGSPSTKMVLGTQEGISKVRGRLFPMPRTYFKVKEEGTDLFGKKESTFSGFTLKEIETLATILVLPTYHPAALLRNPPLKAEAWEDLKLLRDTLAKS